MLGGGVVWACWLGHPPGHLPPGYRFNDPALAWEATLLPARILHLVLFAWLAAPLLEELVFRGLLFRAFERQWGWLAAAIATSVLFGLAHPDKMIATGLGGLVLACVLRRTGSLRACVLLHALFNVLVSWPLLGQVLLSPRSGDLSSPATWALPLACLAVVAVALPAYLWLATRPLRPRRRHLPRRESDVAAPAFRAEVHEQRQRAALGTIVLIRPPSLVALTAVAAAPTVTVLSYLSFAEYAKKAPLAGTLVPASGAIRVAAPHPGLVRERRVREGERVDGGAGPAAPGRCALHRWTTAR